MPNPCFLDPSSLRSPTLYHRDTFSPTAHNFSPFYTAFEKKNKNYSFPPRQQPVSPTLVMPEPKLKWVPLPVDGSIGPPRGLTDFQVGWFWNLFWACLANVDFPGYLPVTANRNTLWTFAGAHRRAHWDANCALVMAAFELREIAGQTMLCLPALVNIVETQTHKLKNHRKVDIRSSHSDPQESGDCSPSQFAFDFELQEQRGHRDHYGKSRSATTGAQTYPYPPGKRAQRVQQTRDVLRESLRRYGG
jgi:hypothetical protein